MSIRVLLVDDHPIVRDGLKAVLLAEADLFVVGETGDGLKVLPMVDRLKPDVLVLDLGLPGLGGVEIARLIRKRYPHICMVILSVHATEAYVAEAFNVGAMGYVLKKDASNDLVIAVRYALEGRHYLSSFFSDEFLEKYLQLAKRVVPDKYESLSKRERQVLHMVTEGLTNQTIAARLAISARTVEKHRANLMEKLEIQTMADLVRFAVERGIQSPE